MRYAEMVDREGHHSERRNLGVVPSKNSLRSLRGGQDGVEHSRGRKS